MPAPKGNQHARKGRDWESALRRALGKHSSGMALAKIAEQVVEQAVAGEWRAIEEIANRLDGKPSQSIDHTGYIAHVGFLTEEELEHIASGSSSGASDETQSPPDTPELH